MASPQPQLRCLSTQPDEGSAAAVAALPAEALNDILDFVFPTLQIDPVPADAIPRDAPIAEQIEAWAGKHGLKAKAARSAAKLILGLRQGLIHGVLPAEALREDCGALGLPDSHTDALTRVWKERGKQLCSTVAMAKHPSSVASLVDAQWRFGVTASTDDVGRVGATFVQLKVSLRGTTGRGRCGRSRRPS